MNDLATPSMLARPIGGRAAWTRDDLREDEWCRVLPQGCRDELQAALAQIRDNPMPLMLWSVDDFELPACRDFMAGVKRILDEGVRFVLIDRFPVDDMTKEEARSLYWLVSSMIARPVAQKHVGTDPNAFLSDVVDTGAKPIAGSGVRPDRTNVDLVYHNDNTFNHTPPHYVGLLCLQPAKSGGVSRIMSFYTAHNALLESYPELLPRLYEPFWLDRQREHDPADDPLFHAPIFQYDGASLSARLCLHQLKNGYEMKRTPMDDRTRAAVKAVEEVFAREPLSLQFTMKRGQVQFCNNRETGHSRTEFVDHEAADQRRHLVRIWLRASGRRSYRG
jgi:alpha-ketoglutarate-dependent taurine dioxygenase